MEKIQYKVNDVVRMKKSTHVEVTHGLFCVWAWILA